MAASVRGSLLALPLNLRARSLGIARVAGLDLCLGLQQLELLRLRRKLQGLALSAERRTTTAHHVSWDGGSRDGQHATPPRRTSSETQLLKCLLSMAVSAERFSCMMRSRFCFCTREAER